MHIETFINFELVIEKCKMDVLTAVIAIFGMGIGAWLIKALLDYRRSMANVKQRVNSKEGKMDFATAIEGAKTALDESQKIRAEMVKKNATAEQLKPLDDKIKQLQFFVDNELVLGYLEPYFDPFIKILMRWIKP